MCATLEMKPKSFGQYRSTAADQATLAAAAAAFPFFTQMFEQLRWPQTMGTTTGLAPKPTLPSPKITDLLQVSSRTLLPINAQAPAPVTLPPPPPVSCFYDPMFRSSFDEIEHSVGQKKRRTLSSPSHSTVSSAGSDSGSDSHHSELRSPTILFRGKLHFSKSKLINIQKH